MNPEAPWAELVVLAERERDLMREGRWEELPMVSAQRLSVAATLGVPPAAARPHLERLVELQREIHAGLSAGRAFTMQKLGNLNRGATAMRGYAGGYRQPSTVDSRA
jgi:predicted ArsR family transcriptional regulator